jgi:alpha-mannosidase
MAEAHLHNAEWLLVVADAIGIVVQSTREAVASVWEDTLLFQIHDAVSASSVNEANHDIIRRGRPQLERLRAVEQLAGALVRRMRTALANASGVFNTLSHVRLVAGAATPSGGWAAARDLPPLDDAVTTTHERIVATDGWEVTSLREPFVDTAERPSARVRVDAAARTVTTAFLIRPSARDLLRAVGPKRPRVRRGRGERPGALRGLPAELARVGHPTLPQGDADRRTCSSRDPLRRWRCQHSPRSPRAGDGPAEASAVRQTLTFAADAPFIDVRTVVDWTQQSKLLKVAFPTTVRAGNAHFGIQFGHSSRPTHANTDRDMATFEAAGRWADLSDAAGAVAICSDVKAGFDFHEGIVRMSLLKAPMQTDRSADFGVRKFTYRIAFHDGNDTAKIVQLSDELNVPVVVHQSEQPQEDAFGER